MYVFAPVSYNPLISYNSPPLGKVEPPGLRVANLLSTICHTAQWEARYWPALMHAVNKIDQSFLIFQPLLIRYLPRGLGEKSLAEDYNDMHGT